MKREIKGIKCDAPGCGYEDMSVNWKDYEETVQKFLKTPCPECGAPLLTQEDVDSLNAIARIAELAEKVSKAMSKTNSEDSAGTTLEVKTDGKGRAKLIFDLPKEFVDKFTKK